MDFATQASENAFVVDAARGLRFANCRYPCVPGIYSEEQTQAWKPIVEVGVPCLSLWLEALLPITVDTHPSGMT